MDYSRPRAYPHIPPGSMDRLSVIGHPSPFGTHPGYNPSPRSQSWHHQYATGKAKSSRAPRSRSWQHQYATGKDKSSRAPRSQSRHHQYATGKDKSSQPRNSKLWHHQPQGHLPQVHQPQGHLPQVHLPLVHLPLGTPQQCEQGLLEHYPYMQLGPDQPPIFRGELPTERWALTVPFSIVAYAAFVTCVVLLILWVPHYTGPFGYGGATVICASIFLCLSYLVAVCEGYCSKVNSFVGNVTHAADFMKKHAELRQAVPTIILTAEAYNWEVTYHGEGTDVKKVVTYRESDTLPFTTCIDVSGPMKGFQSDTNYRIENEKTFGFLNPQIADQYKQMKADMLARASHDDHQSFRIRLEMPDFKDMVTVYTEEDPCKLCLSPCLYRLLTCCLCSWPYRLFFWCCTKKRNYTYVKLISI